MYGTVHKTPDGEICDGPAHVLACPAPFDVIGIAASAGGISALGQLLGALPSDFPCPIVVVQHLPAAAQYRSSLDLVLGRRTGLSVKWAEHGELLRGGTVALAPQDRHIEILPNRMVRLVAGDKVNWVRPAADPLFASIAANFGKRGAGVVLSGASCDGAQGAYEIALSGGRVLVQNRETAPVHDMPAAAIDTGAVDFAFSPQMIACALITLVMTPGAAAWFRVWRLGGLTSPHRRVRRDLTSPLGWSDLALAWTKRSDD